MHIQMHEDQINQREIITSNRDLLKQFRKKVYHLVSFRSFCLRDLDVAMRPSDAGRWKKAFQPHSILRPQTHIP